MGLHHAERRQSLGQQMRDVFPVFLLTYLHKNKPGERNWISIKFMPILCHKKHPREKYRRRRLNETAPVLNETWNEMSPVLNNEMSPVLNETWNKISLVLNEAWNEMSPVLNETCCHVLEDLLSRCQMFILTYLALFKIKCLSRILLQNV